MDQWLAPQHVWQWQWQWPTRRRDHTRPLQASLFFYQRQSSQSPSPAHALYSTSRHDDGMHRLCSVRSVRSVCACGPRVPCTPRSRRRLESAHTPLRARGKTASIAPPVCLLEVLLICADWQHQGAACNCQTSAARVCMQAHTLRYTRVLPLSPLRQSVGWLDGQHRGVRRPTNYDLSSGWQARGHSIHVRRAAQPLCPNGTFPFYCRVCLGAAAVQ